MFERLLKLNPRSKHSIVARPERNGKAYWLGHLLPDAITFDLLRTDEYQALLANPASLASRIPAKYTGLGHHR